MKINWKVRFKNKTWLSLFMAAIVGFAYQILELFGVTMPISNEQIMDGVEIILGLLALLGVVVDGTTVGVNDSTRAMGYDIPVNDSVLTDEEVQNGIY